MKRTKIYNTSVPYKIQQPVLTMIKLKSNPTQMLTAICDQLLPKDVVTIIYMTNSEEWGSNAATVHYFLQLTSYLGIPVIAWNADNFGLEQVSII